VSSTGGSFGSGSVVASGGARAGVGDGFENGSAGLGCDFGAFVTSGPDLRVCRAAYSSQASTQHKAGNAWRGRSCDGAQNRGGG
jgi:hypothetical protein